MPNPSIDRLHEELQTGLGLTPPGDRRAQQRARLVDAVAALAHAIDRGEAEPIRAELDAIAFLCDDYQLPHEAARIRRWIPPEAGR